MRFPRKIARRALVVVLLATALTICMVGVVLAESSQYFARGPIPSAALKYQRDLIRNARYVWGLDAPIAALAAQIQQESGWNPEAHSKFASGLTQFTPDTADWISGAYPKDLSADTPLNPQWALRAQSIYVQKLYTDSDAATPCDQMWMALWKYNGGAGWVHKDIKLAAKNGVDVHYALQVEPFNAGRAPAMFKENRDYPRVILLKWQPVYALWGGVISCK